MQAIDKARTVLESLAPVSFNRSTFDGLTVPEQMFVIADVERVDRGLPPMTGLTAQLDKGAQTGAVRGTDPGLTAATLVGGARIVAVGANWAGGTTNPLGSDYYWMYDDGYHSANGDCPTPGSPGCWGHRDNILGTYASAHICAEYS
ncbi:MAG: hypothetical protein ACLPYY_01945 [Acidimicrobiales bacterium]